MPLDNVKRIYQTLAGATPVKQGLYEISSTQEVPLGTPLRLNDGRTFFYTRNSTVALASNTLIQTGVNFGHADFDLMAIDTYTVGATTVSVTPGGSQTLRANEAAGGYIYIDNGSTGVGQQLKIKSHGATTAATAFDIKLYDPVRAAIAAGDTATLVTSKYSDVITQPGVATGAPVGVAPLAITASVAATTYYYFWLQTYGDAVCLIEGIAGAAVVFNTMLIASPADAGALGAKVAGAGISAVLGTMLNLTAADQDYAHVHLTIAA